MNSYLITGGTAEERLEKAKKIIRNLKLEIRNWENNADILLSQPSPSIGIAQILKLQKFLSLKPHQASIKVIIIPEAEKLTVAAQNAFLKSLEEPPAHSIIILCAQSKESLLPTIISRCQITSISSKSTRKIDEKLLITHYSLLITILNFGVGERLKLIESYEKTREDAIKFCQEMILALRQVLKQPKEKLPITNYQLLITISNFQNTLNLLNSNINVKLCLDNLVIGLYTPSSPMPF